MPTVQQFISEYVKQWRISFEQLSERERNSITRLYGSNYIYPQPVQIQVFIFTSSPQILWIVNRDKNRQDLEIHVSDRDFNDISSFIKNKEKDKDWTGKLNEIRQSFSFMSMEGGNSIWAFGRNFWYAIFKESFFDENPLDKARKDVLEQAKSILRTVENEAITVKTEEIKSEAGKVPDELQRNKLLDAARDIEASLANLKRLEDHDQRISSVEGEIAGVRKLIGTSEAFQDWKLLVDEITEFKRIPHVTKDLFDSEIKRLDQRIDAVKEIRVSSKRTALEIVLAAVAAISTILAALLGAGLFHF